MGKVPGVNCLRYTFVPQQKGLRRAEGLAGLISALRSSVRRRVADESGVAGLVIAGLIMIVAFSALTIFLNRNILPRGLRERPAASANFTKIRAAMQAYAIAHGRLPCPMATTQIGTGTEGDAGSGCAAGTAVAYRGLVPWRTLGLAKNDALDTFGARYFTYGVADVAANYVCAAPLPVPSGTGDNASYLATNATGAATVETTNRYIAMLVSHGEDGLGAANTANGTVVTQTNPPARETRNYVNEAASNRIYSAAPTNLESPADSDPDYFDDIVYPIEYGLEAGQFRLCTDFENDAKDLRGPGRTDDTDVGFTCTSGGCSGDLPITSASGPASQANATLRSTGGGFSTTGAAGSRSYGVGGSTVEYGETLVLTLDVSFDHLSIRATPSGVGSTATQRDILVTAYNGEAKVGSRILPGGTVGSVTQYASVGFDGAKFNALTFTIANPPPDPNPNPAGFSLDGFALCSTTYPCRRNTTAAEQAALTTAFYESAGSLWATQIATEGTAVADASLVATPDDYINAGGVIAMATGDDLRVADGQSGHVVGPYDVAGDIRGLSHVGGDIFFITEDGVADRIYYARRGVDLTVPASPTITYAPQGVVTVGNVPLYTCQDETMVAVYSAMFFKASVVSSSEAATDAACGIWRMNQGVAYAVPMTIPGSMVSGNLMFEGQSRLFVEINTTDEGNELVRYSPLGSATAYTIIDTGGASTVFPPLSTFRPITLPGEDNYLDTLYFRADEAGGTNYALYVVYKDDPNLLSGAYSDTPNPVNLGGGALGSVTGVGTGTVVATVEQVMGDYIWVYYVQARHETGGEQDVFRMTAPNGDTASDDVECWGLDSGSVPSIAVNNGNVYAILAGEVYKGDASDFDSNCETGGSPSEVETAPPGNDAITGVTALHLVFGGEGTVANPSVAGAIYSSGTVNGDVQAFYIAPNDSDATLLDDNIDDPPLDISDLSNPGICREPAPQNMTVVQDTLVFTALTFDGLSTADNCTATRHIFFHDPNDALPGALGYDAVTPTAGFLPLNESATPRAWAP